MKYILNAALLFSVCLTSAPLVAEEAVQEDYRLNTPPRSQNQSAYVPADVFGTEGGYVHPFMSVTLESSDNINNTRTNEISDWKAIYSPGIWLAVPAQREIFLDLNTSNTSPGGHYQQMNKQDSFSRYQAYGLYVADINEYHNHTERNTVRQSAEGFFQYNFRGGLSIDMYDKFRDSEDPMGTGDSAIIDEYKSNIVGVILDYDVTEKVRVRLDYTNFHLRYDDILSRGQDRDDNSYAIYGYFRYSPKTSLFAEYEFVDIEYDINKAMDNKHHYGYAGLEWQPTVKTSLKGKVGYSQRDGETSAGDDSGSVVEFSVAHDFTVKTSIDILALHKINESTVSTAAYSEDSTFSMILNQMITEKIGLAILADYTRVNFKGDITQDRTDHFYTLAPTGKYVFKEWLQAELGYEYIQRNSTQDLFDYTSNSVFLRVSAGF